MKKFSLVITNVLFILVLSILVGCATPSPFIGTWADNSGNTITFGVENDLDGTYKKYRTNDTEMDAMFILKANAPINTEAHANV